MAGAPFAAVPGGIELFLRVAPRASRTRLIGVAAEADGRVALKLAVTAPPESGRANAAAADFLAKALRLPKRDIEIRRGETDRRKTLLLRGDAATIQARLEQWLTADAT
jgi:hypothetical protein